MMASSAVRPMISARLGSILDPEDIKEGTNVYFECSITANPAAYSVSWLHDVSALPAGRPPARRLVRPPASVITPPPVPVTLM